MFQQAMKGNCKQVVRVERIQNEQWYIQYIAHSKGFCRKLNKNTERRLYHGCSQEAANSIIKSCFNRSFAGIHGNTKSTIVLTISISCSLSLGTAYGKGVYFSSNAAYSHGYATPKANGERCMFVARVLIGKTTPGNSSMKTQPIGFDSTTDGNHIFVIYHDAQAYGEYLITYK
jgi:poly [ADP-ribose] polymerase 10/14/15